MPLLWKTPTPNCAFIASGIATPRHQSIRTIFRLRYFEKATTPLYGDIGNDYLDGGADDDVIYGNEGNDILIGGSDIDTLDGGAGQDTYIFNRGDGKDTVIDTKADNNIFRFGAGISANDITLRLGSLMLDFGNGDNLHITDIDHQDVFNSLESSRFEFEDGTVLTGDELLARGFDLDGTAGDDTITGTNTTDRIQGFDGNDRMRWRLRAANDARFNERRAA